MTELPIILDDLIEEELQNQIEDTMFDCSWSFKMDNTYAYNPKSMGMKYRKFLCPFTYDISPSIITNLQSNKKAFSIFSNVIKKTCNQVDFNLKKIHRCIAGIQGVQVIREKSKICNIHVNQNQDHLVMLYYVNDSDGDTILYDKTLDDILYDEKKYFDKQYEFNIVNRITPKKGRVLLFDGKTYHSASSPSKGIRCIITLDLFGEFKDGSYKFTAPSEEKIKNNFIYQ